MRKWLAVTAVLAFVLSSSIGAQGGRGGGPGAAPPRPVAGHGVDVPGWWARLDDPAELTRSMTFASSGSGIRATTGPSAIFWDPQQSASGQYTTRAMFTVSKAATPQQPYGLFIGGTDLGADGQRYTEFLIRPDGKYLIRKRSGSSTSQVGSDWADHAAILKADTSGKSSNELSIRVAADSVTFLANGREVAKHPASAVDVDGMSGVRVGRDLDVQIDGFVVDVPASATR